MDVEIKILTEFKENAIYRMSESMRMVNISLDKLSETDIWEKPNHSSNSIANLILHLCGNITQYAISSLSQKEDLRNRAREFSIEKGYTKEELISMLSDTVSMAKSIISGLSVKESLKIREVQGFKFSGIGIITHVVEHLSYHTGQIALWTKILKNKDLGFYDGIDLEVKNN